MSSFLRKICAFIVFCAYFAFGMTPPAHAYTGYNEFPLYDNIGNGASNESSNYIGKLCAATYNGATKWYKIKQSDIDNNSAKCYWYDGQQYVSSSATSSDVYGSSYSIKNSELKLSGAIPPDEVPIKQICDDNGENCENESLIGYRHYNYNPIRLKPNGATNTWGFETNNTFYSNTSKVQSSYAWWQGINNKTKLNITWLPGEGSYWSNPDDGASDEVSKTCVYGDDSNTDESDCKILSANTFQAPNGKYFDGWACYSGTQNCYISRYLPNDYENLSITPVGASGFSSQDRYQDTVGGTVPVTLATAYTGNNNITLTASWAPHEITFQCQPYANNPFVGYKDESTGVDYSQTVITQYTNINGQTGNDVVYGSKIPFKTNVGNICKSPYYKYDNDRYNEQWCQEFLKDAVTNVYSTSSKDNISHDFCGTGSASVRNSDGTYDYQLVYYCTDDATLKLRASCASPSNFYNCGTFEDKEVGGQAPYSRYYRSVQSVDSDTGVSTYGTPYNNGQNITISNRNIPAPAYPYPIGNQQCSSYTIPGATSNDSNLTYYPDDNHPLVTGGSATSNSPGYGCCDRPKYGDNDNTQEAALKQPVFLGWKVTKRSNGYVLINGEPRESWVASSDNPRLLKPGEYGKGSKEGDCDLSTMDNSINPDEWDPGSGCNLWPWSSTVNMTAMWDYADIVITLDGNTVLEQVHLDYDTGFYETYTLDSVAGHTFSDPIERIDGRQIPTNSNLKFLGYYWCSDNSDDCDTPLQIIDADGRFTSNHTFTKVDATIYPHWGCEDEGYALVDGVCVPKYTIKYQCDPNDPDSTQYGTGVTDENVTPLSSYTTRTAADAGCNRPGYDGYSWRYGTGNGQTVLSNVQIPAGVVDALAASAVDGVITLKAQWGVQCHKITFNDNNESDTNVNGVLYRRTDDPQWYTIECKSPTDPSLDMPTFEGHVFAGYYDDGTQPAATQVFDAELNDVVSGTMGWNPVTDTTLYAHWDCPAGYHLENDECVQDITVTYKCWSGDETGKSDTAISGSPYTVRNIDWYGDCVINNNLLQDGTGSFEGWLFSGDNQIWPHDGDGGDVIPQWTWNSGQTFVAAYPAKFTCDTTYWAGSAPAEQITVLGETLTMPAMNCIPKPDYVGWLNPNTEWVSSYANDLATPVTGATCTAGDISVAPGATFNWVCPTDLLFQPTDNLITKTITVSCGENNPHTGTFEMTYDNQETINDAIIQWFADNCGGHCSNPTDTAGQAWGYKKVCADEWGGQEIPDEWTHIGEDIPRATGYACYATPAGTSVEDILRAIDMANITNLNITSISYCPHYVNYKCSDEATEAYTDSLYAVFNKPYTTLTHQAAECENGHAFVNWKPEGRDNPLYGEGESVEEWPFNEDVTLVAQWGNAVDYQIIYHMNGDAEWNGGVHPDTYTVDGLPLEITGVLRREHSVFLGWCDDAGLTQNCGQPRTIPAGTTGTVHFYAKWECAKPYHLNPAGTACEPCPAGTYWVNGACEPCPEYYSSNPGAVGIEQCFLADCPDGEHIENGECVSDTKECDAPHAARATRTWNPELSAYGSCQVQECIDGYHIASNACVLDAELCTVPNGRGDREWNGTAWGDCVVTQCDPGFEISDNACTECENRRVNDEIAVSSYASGCEIPTCMHHGQKYILENNECRLICQDHTDDTGSMQWDNQSKKCVRTCKPGYKMW